MPGAGQGVAGWAYSQAPVTTFPAGKWKDKVQPLRYSLTCNTAAKSRPDTGRKLSETKSQILMHQDFDGGIIIKSWQYWDSAKVILRGKVKYIVVQPYARISDNQLKSCLYMLRVY